MVFSSSNTVAQHLILAWVKRGLPGAVKGISVRCPATPGP
jgi:hypothetical protein